MGFRGLLELCGIWFSAPSGAPVVTPDYCGALDVFYHVPPLRIDYGLPLTEILDDHEIIVDYCDGELKVRCP